ncbi:MAG: ribosomal RNA small subunit methyltransferase A [Candidatus Niyogibacteria bacterium]|nr:ribosomal RNA small subunit methyltransferase A [Candidatus Niyogibacteria bacterium]
MKLGQHFLKSESLARKIAETAAIAADDIVLEIGPGKGILTAELIKRAKKVIAVEKDIELVKFLKEKFTLAGDPAASRLKIIHADALKFNFKTQLGGRASKYKIVANIPYYITSRFLRIFLESDCRPSAMTLMLQKEVAQRIIAQPPKMNLLAVSVQVFSQPKIAFKVSKKYFSPAPKVDSAVIAIANISRDFFIKNNIAEKDFFTLVKAGFSHKRKLLINNLGIQLPNKEKRRKIFKKCGIPEKARAENLTLENWACLCEKK